MTSYKEQYYSLAEDEMQKLIADSKRGSQKAQAAGKSFCQVDQLKMYPHFSLEDKKSNYIKIH